MPGELGYQPLPFMGQRDQVAEILGMANGRQRMQAALTGAPVQAQMDSPLDAQSAGTFQERLKAQNAGNPLDMRLIGRAQGMLEGSERGGGYADERILQHIRDQSRLMRGQEQRMLTSSRPSTHSRREVRRRSCASDWRNWINSRHLGQDLPHNASKWARPMPTAAS